MMIQGVIIAFEVLVAQFLEHRGELPADANLNLIDVFITAFAVGYKFDFFY